CIHSILPNAGPSCADGALEPGLNCLLKPLARTRRSTRAGKPSCSFFRSAVARPRFPSSPRGHGRAGGEARAERFERSKAAKGRKWAFRRRGNASDSFRVAKSPLLSHKLVAEPAR